MVQVQYCSEWTEFIGYGTARLFDSFVRYDWWRHNLYCVQLFKDLATRDKDQSCASLLPPQVLIIDWFLEIRHKWEPT